MTSKFTKQPEESITPDAASAEAAATANAVGRGQALGVPPEVRTLDAAAILGISQDTVLKLRKAGVLPYRNVAPPGSTRPTFRFRLDAVLKLRTSYEVEKCAPHISNEPPRDRSASEEVPSPECRRRRPRRGSPWGFFCGVFGPI